jgi:hypothetical protein
MPPKLIDGPIIDRHADDRKIEQSTGLEPIQGVKRHHLRQVTGDPEDHQHVTRRRWPSRTHRSALP